MVKRPGEKRSLYLRGETLQVVEDMRVKNLSNFINKVVERYDLYVKHEIPALNSDEFAELFVALNDFGFENNADILVQILPTIIKNRDVSNALVQKVHRMTIPKRLALIDVIERSQRNEE